MGHDQLSYVLKDLLAVRREMSLTITPRITTHHGRTVDVLVGSKLSRHLSELRRKLSTVIAARSCGSDDDWQTSAKLTGVNFLFFPPWGRDAGVTQPLKRASSDCLSLVRMQSCLLQRDRPTLGCACSRESMERTIPSTCSIPRPVIYEAACRRHILRLPTVTSIRKKVIADQFNGSRPMHRQPESG